VQKNIEKMLKTFSVMQKKSDLDPPFWIDPPFLSNLTKYGMLSIYVADKKQTHGKDRSRKCWKIEKLCYFERHLESDKNLFFYEIYPIEIQAHFKKQNAKMYTTQPDFQPFLESP
jgi:hypothetical protein